MSNNSNGNSEKASGSIGFFGVVQLILITLKLSKVINWPLWLVLLPIEIFLGFTAVFIVFTIIVALMEREDKL